MTNPWSILVEIGKLFVTETILPVLVRPALVVCVRSKYLNVLNKLDCHFL